MLTNLSRKNRLLMLVVLFLAISAFFPEQLFSPIAADASITGTPPPAGYNDWIIAQNTTVQDEVIVLNGSVLINGPYNLTLRNVTLKFNCTYQGEYNLTVNSGGALYVHNCTITGYETNDRWFLAAKAGSTLLLNATTISDAGYTAGSIKSGVWINTNNAKVVNCAILRNCYGITLHKANNTLIKDNQITFSWECGIYIIEANNTIVESNSITNCISGIYTHTSPKNIIEHNDITNITGWAAIWLVSSGNSTIRGNTVTNSDETGIRMRSSGNSTISENRVTNCYYYEHAGIELGESGQSTVSENAVTNCNGPGIALDSSGQNIISGNTITNSSVGGLLLQHSGHSTISGNTITNSTGTGFELYRSDNSTVSENVVTNNAGCGIWLSSSGHSTVSGNTVTECHTYTAYGILLGDSRNSTVHGNTVANSSREGIWLDGSGQSTVSENRVTESWGAGIGLEDSNQSTISANTVTDAFPGIDLSSSGNSTISGNTVTNSSRRGITLGTSGQSTISGNTVTNSELDGIRLYKSGQSTISGNTVTHSCIGERFDVGIDYAGIKLYKSGQSTVRGNMVTNSSNGGGIWLSSSLQSTISGNNITNSGYWGIYIHQNTSACLLWGNKLTKNAEGNAYDGNGTNQWDNGTHGNWYDDYAGPDLDEDGIGDHSYSIGGGLVEDRYPLMNLVFPDTNPPTLDSPADVTYTVHSTGHTITWQPTDANPFWYQIFRDGVLIANTTWDGAAITLEIDDLAVGTYNYTLVVLDRAGYRTTDEVLVTVKPIEEETTEEEPQLIPGFAFPLVGLSFAVGWFLTRSRRRKRAYS